MARRRSPARLVIALSVAAVLAVFLVYTSLAGGTPSLQPSELKGRSGTVALAGKVVGPIRRDGRTIRFRLRDVQGTASVPVVYTGSVPDLFAPAKDIGIQGELRRGIFVGQSGTLVTKCPSKYAPTRGDSAAS